MNESVSIIMPAYNAGKYISEAIQSVLNQNYIHWELLIVNDGSIDDTQSIIDQFLDPRIIKFEQTNLGVSAARNIGLKHMTGDYFCFLDGDDILPIDSLRERVKVLSLYPSIDFVDGKVNYINVLGSPLDKSYLPSLKGEAYSSLLKLKSNCFLGNTWMIRRETKKNYNFDISLKYCEDLYFYLTISEGKQYDYITQPILLYRQSDGSAMKNLKGLESGYIKLIQKIRAFERTNNYHVIYLKIKITKIMVLSHLFNGKDWKSAIGCPFRILSV